MNKTILLIGLLCLPLAACGDFRSEREENMDTIEVQFPMPQGGKVEFDAHGNEEWFAYGAITGKEGVNANGVSQSHLFEDGFFLHTVNLNIEPAEAGYFYEGWIVKDSSVVSTGRMSSPLKDVRHNLRFESSTDYSDHLNVIVTLEPDDGNPAPAEHIAEGKLRVTKR